MDTLTSALTSASAMFAAESAAVSTVYDLSVMGPVADVIHPYAAIFRAGPVALDLPTVGSAVLLGMYPSEVAALGALDKYHAWAAGA